ncbi:MAG: flagellar motor switch protein FliN [candidate division Zixibacteria bacterium]|nr:flagellar motor switch protein FliN [candidate division Zixibacteria bacterium]
MADDELLEGEGQEEKPEESGQETPESPPKSEADEPEAGQKVDVDTAQPEEEEPEAEEAAQAESESEPEPEGEAAEAEGEDDSIDDMVEQQMLAELEKLENEGDASAGDPAETAVSASGSDTSVQRPDFPTFSESASPKEGKNLELLLDVNLPISIELGRTSMRIKDILNLGPGAVVELQKLAGEPVDLLVNNKIVARGEVVVVDENFGLRITSLLSPEERLKMLE